MLIYIIDWSIDNIGNRGHGEADQDGVSDCDDHTDIRNAGGCGEDIDNRDNDDKFANDSASDHNSDSGSRVDELDDKAGESKDEKKSNIRDNVVI